MQSVGQKDTGPEMAIRRALHALGYRFRLHRKDLPGKPDLVFPSRRMVLFVHGCFWHGHGCSKGRLPKSRPEFWVPKIQANRDRDDRAVNLLEKMGWKTFTVWQCEVNDTERSVAEIVKFLGPPPSPGGAPVDGFVE